jgi:hypothetical protein
VLLAGEALVGQLVVWLHAPVAEGQVAGGAAGHFVAAVAALPLPVAHDAVGAEACAEQRRSMVAVDVEQAVFPFSVP